MEKLKFLHFADVVKIVALPLQNQNICDLEIFNQNRHLPCLSANKSFWKFVKYFWRCRISAGTVYSEKLKFLHFLDVGKVLTLLLENQNICALEILNQNSHLPCLSAKKKIFENSLNTFEDIEFRLGQRKREKLKFLHFLDIWKVVTLLLRNQNICAPKIFNVDSHLPLLSAKKSFLKIR